jgi:hypothetical protein
VTIWDKGFQGGGAAAQYEQGPRLHPSTARTNPEQRGAVQDAGRCGGRHEPLSNGALSEQEDSISERRDSGTKV